MEFIAKNLISNTARAAYLNICCMSMSLISVFSKLANGRCSLLLLLAITLVLDGCGAVPKVSQESALGVVPGKFEKVVLVLDPGVFQGFQTFDKFHIEHLGALVEQNLKNDGVRTSMVLVRSIDLNQAVLLDAIKTLQPSHIVRITASQRFSSPSVAGYVTWLVQIDQKDAGNASARYLAGFKFTLIGDACITGAVWGIDRQLNCFRESVRPLMESIHKKGF